jgi:hypothetical protein
MVVFSCCRPDLVAAFPHDPSTRLVVATHLSNSDCDLRVYLWFADDDLVALREFIMGSDRVPQSERLFLGRALSPVIFHAHYR